MVRPSLSRVLAVVGAATFCLVALLFGWVASSSRREFGFIEAVLKVTTYSAGITAIVLSLVVAVWSFFGIVSNGMKMIAARLPLAEHSWLFVLGPIALVFLPRQLTEAGLDARRRFVRSVVLFPVAVLVGVAVFKGIEIATRT